MSGCRGYVDVTPGARALAKGYRARYGLAPRLSAASAVVVLPAARSTGSVRTGGGVSTTVILKLPVAVLPAPSSAEHDTSVEPAAKVEPDAGTQVTATTPSTTSVGDAVNVASAPARPWPRRVGRQPDQSQRCRVVDRFRRARRLGVAGRMPGPTRAAQASSNPIPTCRAGGVALLLVPRSLRLPVAVFARTIGRPSISVRSSQPRTSCRADGETGHGNRSVGEVNCAHPDLRL